MIKSKHLRIGNLISDVERNVLTVRTISQNRIDIEEKQEKYSPADLNAIQLNHTNVIGQDNFLPYEFPNFPEYQHLRRGEIILRFPKEGTEVDTVGVFVMTQIEVEKGKIVPVNLFIKRIRFVHELQNVFFTLTGKEWLIDKTDFELP